MAVFHRAHRWLSAVPDGKLVEVPSDFRAEFVAAAFLLSVAEARYGRGVRRRSLHLLSVAETLLRGCGAHQSLDQAGQFPFRE